MVAKGAKLQDTTSLVIEATAINEFLRFCRDEGIRQIIVESYSWIIVQVLNQEWEVSWSVSIIVNSIKELMRVITVRVVHSLREGNTLSDFFTNLVFDFTGEVHFNSFSEVPVVARRIINLDKAGTTQVRRSDLQS